VVDPPEYDRLAEQLSEQLDRLLADLEAAPITSATDAIATMRAVLNELPLFYKDEIEYGHAKAADRCLHKVLAWLEAFSG